MLINWGGNKNQTQIKPTEKQTNKTLGEKINNHISSHYDNPLIAKVGHAINSLYVHFLGNFCPVTYGILLTNPSSYKITYIQPHIIVLSQFQKTPKSSEMEAL